MQEEKKLMDSKKNLKQITSEISLLFKDMRSLTISLHFTWILGGLPQPDTGQTKNIVSSTGKNIYIFFLIH